MDWCGTVEFVEKKQMNFKVSTLKSGYTLKESKELEKLGFQFKPARVYAGNRPKHYIQMPSYEAHVNVDIQSLEELVAFVTKYGGKVIIDACKATMKELHAPKLIIYDDYYE